MKIVLSWLKDYLPQVDVEALPDLMTRAGIEVDFIEYIKPSFKGVVAVRIGAVAKHPTSQNLVVAKVFDAKGEHTVVCSDLHCYEGMVTAYAPVGSTIHNKEIGSTMFGDIASDGVLVSEHELGLSEYNEGIMDLPKTLKEGTLLEEYLADTVYEVSITPNLGHCQSVMGVARELAAFLGQKLAKAPWKESVALQAIASPKLSVAIQDQTLSPRYSALLLEHVRVAPSPSLVRLRLERSGIRSKNNVVDATNYISHDIGQPLHAFDAARVHSGHIIVRASTKNESLTMLDEVTHKLPEGTIVIADGQQILAAGGIMGGESSSVSASTTSVILESAHFNPSAIRKARTKLAISTDSSKRFERGADENITLKALEAAHAMLKGADAVACVDVYTPKQPLHVTCRLSRAALLLGYEVSADEAESAFTRLELSYTFDGQDTYTVTVPTFRHDIKEEVDLIEEIGRLVGLQRDSIKPARYSASKLAHNPLYIFEGELRRRLLSFGLQEAITSDLISPSMASLVSSDGLVEMMNPLSVEQSVLRPSIMPGLLDVIKRNINQRTLDLNFFEVGHVHLKKGSGFVEPRVCSIMLTGKRYKDHFLQPKRDWDFFDLKGMLEELFATLGYTDMTVQKSDLSMLHPGRQAKLFVDGVHIGVIGEIHPELLLKAGISQAVLFAECDMIELMHLARKDVKMQELTHFPSSERDWTATLSKAIPYGEILHFLMQEKPAICEHISLLSLFEHEKLGKDKHNVTLRFIYRDRQKTISQDEVDKAHERLVSQVANYLAEKYQP